MPLRNFSLRVLGGGERVDDFRAAGELLAGAERSIPSATVVLTDEPSRPHEIAAQMVEDRQRGTAILPGALQAKPERRTPGFVHLDVWARPEKVHDLIAKAPRPFVLYCDDGDKQLEVVTFGPSLRPGDYLAVHDVGTEFFPELMPGGYEEQLLHGLTGFYRKAGAAPC